MTMNSFQLAETTGNNRVKGMIVDAGKRALQHLIPQRGDAAQETLLIESETTSNTPSPVARIPVRERTNKEDLDILKSMYTIPVPIDEAITHILMGHADIVEVLREAYHHLCDLFPGSELILEVYSDPDTLHRERLSVSVKTSMPRYQAHDQMDTFDLGWWMDRSGDIDHAVIIMLG